MKIGLRNKEVVPQQWNLACIKFGKHFLTSTCIESFKMNRHSGRCHHLRNLSYILVHVRYFVNTAYIIHCSHLFQMGHQVKGHILCIFFTYILNETCIFIILCVGGPLNGEGLHSHSWNIETFCPAPDFCPNVSGVELLWLWWHHQLGTHVEYS